MPCPRCGRTTALGSTCLPCRRLDRVPTATVAAKVYGSATCPICDQSFDKHRPTQVYCTPGCRDARRNWPTSKTSSASRGYGAKHRALREEWKPLVSAGLVDCHALTCLVERDGGSKRLDPYATWHLGHTQDRTGWTGPEHPRCSVVDGARRARARQAGG